MRDVLALLARKYDYPVDIEFTANFRRDGSFRINLLQCRPLQTKGLGKTVELPKITERTTAFSIRRGISWRKCASSIDYVIYVDARGYAGKSEQENTPSPADWRADRKLGDENLMLIGPGRFGTTTPSLGVPVHFTELNRVQVMCEYSSSALGLMPELSTAATSSRILWRRHLLCGAVCGEGGRGLLPGALPEK